MTILESNNAPAQWVARILLQWIIIRHRMEETMGRGIIGTIILIVVVVIVLRVLGVI